MFNHRYEIPLLDMAGDMLAAVYPLNSYFPGLGCGANILTCFLQLLNLYSTAANSHRMGFLDYLHVY